MEPGDVAENVNGGLSHMSEAKVTRTEVYMKKILEVKKLFFFYFFSCNFALHKKHFYVLHF